MIDSTKASTFDQALLVKFANAPTITPTEMQERGRAIEQVARVDSEQLKNSMDFLQERFSQQLLAQKMINEEQPTSQTQQAQMDSAGTLAAVEYLSDEQAQAQETAESQTNEQALVLAGTLAAGELKSDEQAQALAALDGASTEENKKAKLLRNAEITNDGTKAPSGSVATSGSGEVTDPDVTNPDPDVTNPDPNVPPKPGGFDEGFKAPWEPLEPPPPQFPDGFDINSLLNGDYNPITVLTQIAMLFSETMKDLVEGRIAANKELSTVTSALQQETIEKKTEEQLEQLEKSEQAGKAGNCITILVTVAITLLSVALAFVTGGAASALLALGITAAFLVVDMSMQAAGETPLSAMMMEPLMTHVIMPVIMELMKFFQGILEEAGASEELARTLAMVFAIVVVAAAIIGLILGAKNSSMLGSLMSKIGEKISTMMGAVTPEFIKNAGAQAIATFSGFATNIMAKAASGVSAKAGQQAFSKALATGASREAAEEAAERAAGKALEQFMTTATSNVTDAMMGAIFVGAIGTSTAGIIRAEYTKEVTETQAIMDQILEAMLLSSEDLNKYVDKLREAYQQAQDLIDLAFQNEKGQLQTSQAILRNIAIGV